jgi:catechol 2,3-dioxygenase-like lactoylglutathione lyase family enzyme
VTVELNHTIVPAHDLQTSAKFLAELLGLTVDPPVAHFTPVTPANQVTLDYGQLDDFEPHHYAFMVSGQEFDAAVARIQDGGITYDGDPACQEEGQIHRSKRYEGRRGTYFSDPNGHLTEILTPGTRIAGCRACLPCCGAYFVSSAGVQAWLSMIGPASLLRPICVAAVLGPPRECRNSSG